MTLGITHRLQNGPGNKPDANKWMNNYDWLTALIFKSGIINGGMEGWSTTTSFANPADNTTILYYWAFRKSGTSASTTNVAIEDTIIVCNAVLEVII